MTIRQILCWIGLVGIIVMAVLARGYDVPVLYETSEYRELYDGRKAGIARVEVKDYSNVPLWVEVVREQGWILILAGLVLIWGGLTDFKG